MRKYAVFILSHGRADRVYTLKTLQKCGYTGDWYVVCDNEDRMLSEYKRRFKDRVLVFAKDEAAKMFDMMDNFEGRNVVVFARNYVFRLAKELGLTHFVVLDDDYTEFEYNFVINERRLRKRIKKLDDVFELMFEMLDNTGALTVAFAQTGDFVGGINDFMKKGFKRKAMNAFFFRTDRVVEFMGRLNEDVNMYVFYGMRGGLIFSISTVVLRQKQTQSNKGGLTEEYLNLGTYVKSFYTVMLAPSCVKIILMGNLYKRIYHKIEWDYCVPKILSDRYKKGAASN